MNCDVRSYNLLPATLAFLLATGSAVLAQDCVEPPGGMVAWWPGDGNAKDIVGGHDGSPSGDVSFEPAMVGLGFLIDDVDSFVEIADAPALDLSGDEITVDAWIEDQTPRNLGVVNKRSGSSGYGLSINGAFCGQEGGVKATIFGSFGQGFDHCSQGVIPEGKPTHLAWTYSRSLGESRIYINGELDSTLESTTAIRANGVPLTISGGGLVDEVEIFDRALTATEIQAIYEAGSAGKCKPSTSVRGGAAGYHLEMAVCRNVTTGQEVVVTPPDRPQPDAKSWDCEEAGLIVNPGDSIVTEGHGFKEE